MQTSRRPRSRARRTVLGLLVALLVLTGAYGTAWLTGRAAGATPRDPSQADLQHAQQRTICLTVIRHDLAVGQAEVDAQATLQRSTNRAAGLDAALVPVVVATDTLTQDRLPLGVLASPTTMDRFDELTEAHRTAVGALGDWAQAGHDSGTSPTLAWQHWLATMKDEDLQRRRFYQACNTDLAG